MRPRLLDLYCGAGGAARGYIDAGFEVVGVDIEPQPNYPATFHQLDATALRMDTLNGCIHEASAASALPGRSDVCLGVFDAVHASPPCQASSALTKGTNRGREYPQLIPSTREFLASLAVPTVIENVNGADIRKDVTLCGEMFGLGVIRHRHFELSGFDIAQPEHVEHRGRVAGWRHGVYYEGPYFAVYGDGGGKGTLDQWREAMGTPWMQTRHEIAESIPPAYTEFIGRQLLAHIESEAAA